MDFCLLFSAKLLAKNNARILRLVFASAVGAAFAVLFPLLNLQAWAAATLKICSGIFICLIAYKFGSMKGFVKFSAAFLLMTALLGGALIGLFSLVGMNYAGDGYMLSKVPIGIPMLGVLLLILLAKRLGRRLKKGGKNRFRCRIYVGQSTFSSVGFVDSGNAVYFKGEPISVVSKFLVLNSFDELCISGGVKIHTVSGSKILDVFTADRVEIELDGEKKVFKNVKMGISEKRMGEVIFHPDLLEE